MKCVWEELGRCMLHVVNARTSLAFECRLAPRSTDATGMIALISLQHERKYATSDLSATLAHSPVERTTFHLETSNHQNTRAAAVWTISSPSSIRNKIPNFGQLFGCLYWQQREFAVFAATLLKMHELQPEWQLYWMLVCKCCINVLWRPNSTCKFTHICKYVCRLFHLIKQACEKEKSSQLNVTPIQVVWRPRRDRPSCDGGSEMITLPLGFGQLISWRASESAALMAVDNDERVSHTVCRAMWNIGGN